MLIIPAAVVVALVLLLVAEGLLAQRGARLDEPDVATLSAVHTPTDSRGEIRFLWLGDSTAAAVGTTEPRYAVSSQVDEWVSGNCRVTVNTRVIAKSGATIDDVLDTQLPVAQDLGADVAIVSVGANDTIQLTSLARFLQRYRAIVAGLIAAGVAPDHIVLLGVPDMGSPPRLARPLRDIAGFRSRRLDARVRALARETGARYVDIFAGTSVPFRKHPTRYFAADKYHPNDSGYGVWARAIRPVVAETCG